MAITSPEMWIGIIAVALLFALSIMIGGQDLLERDLPLDQRSIEYITTFSTAVKTNNLQNYSTNESLESKKTNPLLDALNNFPLAQDFLGAVNFFVKQTRGVMDFLSTIYNLPSFFIQGFGLNMAAFSHVVNIVSYTLFVIMLIVMVRLVK